MSTAGACSEAEKLDASSGVDVRWWVGGGRRNSAKPVPLGIRPGPHIPIPQAPGPPSLRLTGSQVSHHPIIPSIHCPQPTPSTQHLALLPSCPAQVSAALPPVSLVSIRHVAWSGAAVLSAGQFDFLVSGTFAVTSPSLAATAARLALGSKRIHSRVAGSERSAAVNVMGRRENFLIWSVTTSRWQTPPMYLVNTSKVHVPR
ncbi:hypothetical protein BKA80DRAFT_283571 [Phyllosticta citrichinensis]